MNVLIAVVVLALVVSACTTTVWQKPGATAEDLERDSRECDRQADRQARAAWEPGHTALSNKGAVPSLRQMEHRRRYAQCMRARGYMEMEKSG
jgi:hypothetical protein